MRFDGITTLPHDHDGLLLWPTSEVQRFVIAGFGDGPQGPHAQAAMAIL